MSDAPLNPRFVLRTGPHLGSAGEAIAHLPDGRVVFIEGAAPDEEVQVELTEQKPRFARAQVLEVLEPGPARVEPRCPLFSSCGGCTLQHLDAEAQTASKVNTVLQQLRRISRLDVDDIELEPAWRGDAYGYRARARFHVGRDGTVGFRARSSRSVVDVERCPVLAPALEGALGGLRQNAGRIRAGSEVDAIAEGDRALLRLQRGRRPAPGRLPDSVRWAHPKGEPLLHEDRFGTVGLWPGLFAQSNPAGNAALLESVWQRLEALGPFNKTLELYAGSGNLSRVIWPHTQRLWTVEGDAQAVAMAKRTLDSEIEIQSRSVESAIAKLKEDFELVVVNPPRTGLSATASAGLKAMGPKWVLYVSCSPATFARDVERMGLRPRWVRLFDLYPQTAHAELLAVLGP